MNDRRPRSEPIPLANGLTSVVRSLKADAVTVRNVFSGWEDAVGPGIASHARPVKLDGTTLLVEVDEPAWATQLRFLQSDLAARLGQYGGTPIERIEVVVAGAAGTAKGRNGRSVRGRRPT